MQRQLDRNQAGDPDGDQAEMLRIIILYQLYCVADAMHSPTFTVPAEEQRTLAEINTTTAEIHPDIRMATEYLENMVVVTASIRVMVDHQERVWELSEEAGKCEVWEFKVPARREEEID